METRQLLMLCAAAVSLVHAGNHEVYSGHTVHGVVLRNSSDAALLQRLQAQLGLDLWQAGVAGERDALLMVAPHHEDQLLKSLDDEGVAHYVHMDDVAKAIEKNNEEISMWKSTREHRMVFQDYLRYPEVRLRLRIPDTVCSCSRGCEGTTKEEGVEAQSFRKHHAPAIRIEIKIDAYMESIAAQYPNLVTLVNAGKSFEGRDIKYLKISTTNFNDPSKPIYFMTAMIHAREWVTTPVALYSIYRLVENLRSEDSDLLSDVDWIIMPLVNPDGYEFTHTDTRLWRKTRSFNPAVSSVCYGVDGNRNFDVLFGTSGVSSDPCNLTYPGTHAFSELEIQYVRDILQEYLNRIQIYMDIHSHGNWVLFGYGDYSLPPNAPQLHHVGATMGAVMDALKLPQADFYRVGNSATILYGSSGSAQDYGQVVGVPFSYTLELPGYGYGFLVPPQFQDQINEETWQGIAVTARLARSYYSTRYNAATTTAAPTTAATTAATAATTAATAATTEATAATTAATAATTAATAATTAATAATTEATAATTEATAATTEATAATTEATAATTEATAATTEATAATTAATAATTEATAATTEATAATTEATAATTEATAATTEATAATTEATAATTEATAATTEATAATTEATAATTEATAATTEATAATTAATAATTEATAATTEATAATSAATAATTEATAATSAATAATSAATTEATAATTAATAATTDATVVPQH